ncbi:integral membrane protein [Trichoderma gamsii]|uniref:Integral membrane protein n=1 Tax=Trichoderma gamsii TaxID=398673 RepID=A0A2P4ZQW3_9HYPO|nr:integral membrane protein [Trichoderma gamsii]PON26664.1 integral membrane protein [Trichoderma gamsii]
MNSSAIQQPMSSFDKTILYSSPIAFILSCFWLFLCGTRLQFNDYYLWHNICFELPLELGCQAFGSWLGWLMLKRIAILGSGGVSQRSLHGVLAIEVVKIVIVAMLSGRDSNHKTYDQVPKNPYKFIVGPEYHALHHVDPAAYMGSTFYFFDWLFGTAYTLKSRRVTMTGASGAFGKALIRELHTESVACIQQLKFGVDWTYTNYDAAIPTLANTDILILAHGSKRHDVLKANCDSAVQLISLFKQHRKSDPNQIAILPEIWYVGSETELHPSFGIQNLQAYSTSKRAFLPHARKLYDDDSILYRHIVPVAFQSTMGSAILSAQWAARTAMWWIRRGARPYANGVRAKAKIFFSTALTIMINKLSQIILQEEVY